MFTEETRRDIAAIATGLGIEPAALLAVAEVESSGKAFAIVGGKAEPLIRFEGHYFDKRLSPSNRARARREGLASPVAGAVANPRTQAGRWTLLAKARAIDAAAADESVSWGLGQVMGAHWAWLGHASIDGLVAEARGGVAGQIRLMVRYIEKAGLVAALRRRDWEAFARGYNGPQYTGDMAITRKSRLHTHGMVQRISSRREQCRKNPRRLRQNRPPPIPQGSLRPRRELSGAV